MLMLKKNEIWKINVYTIDKIVFQNLYVAQKMVTSEKDENFSSFSDGEIQVKMHLLSPIRIHEEGYLHLFEMTSI